MSDPRKKYEVWGFSGTGDSFAFSSDDAVEVVHWIRKHPVWERDFNVHPTDGQGREFHTNAMISHDFISKHRMDVADDIVKTAFEAGVYEGVAQELSDLFFGR